MNIGNLVKLTSIPSIKNEWSSIQPKRTTKAVSVFRDRVLVQIKLLEHGTSFERGRDKVLVNQGIQELRDILDVVNTCLVAPQRNIRSFAFGEDTH